jgi:SprT protein
MSRASTDLESVLSRFIPPASVPLACQLLREHPHHINITPPRTTKHGDFTVRPDREKHHITVNGNLNPYAFLITLMHELAHLITYNEFKNRVKPHGTEWKNNFKKTLGPFLQLGVFPQDIQQALHHYLSNPDAATCSNIPLSVVLARYDRNQNPNVILLESLPDGHHFYFGKDKKEFVRMHKNRKRILCKEISTRLDYLFSPVSKVLRKETTG